MFLERETGKKNKKKKKEGKDIFLHLFRRCSPPEPLHRRRLSLLPRHRLLRAPQQLPDLPRLHLPVPHLLHQRRRLGPPKQALDVAQPRPEADAADARAAAVALRALYELVGVFRALAVEGAPLAGAAAPEVSFVRGFGLCVWGGGKQGSGEESWGRRDRIVFFFFFSKERNDLLCFFLCLKKIKFTHISQGVTPVPAHSRHLAGSAATEAATGGEASSSSAAAAEALEGADSAAMSEERPNAPAASAAALREVEGAAGEADAAALVVAVEDVPVVSLVMGRACVSERQRGQGRRGEKLGGREGRFDRRLEKRRKYSPSSPVLEAWAATALLLEVKRPPRRGAGATAAVAAEIVPAPRHEGQTWWRACIVSQEKRKKKKKEE